MRFSRVTAAIVMASLSSPLFAGAEQSIGTLTSASQGTYISRGGKLIPAVAGQALLTGDRVLTRDKASARVALQGCSVNLASTSIMPISATSCTTKPVSFAAPQDTTDSGAAPTDEQLAQAAALGVDTTGLTAAEIAIAIAAALAVGAGIYTAADNNDSTPASP